MAVTLRPVSTYADFRAVIALRVSPEQERFVASNLYSLAELPFLNETFRAMAIYAEDTLVGFTMFGIEEEDGKYWIYRLMIDKAYQRRGYGRAALLMIIDLLRNEGKTGLLKLSYEPENEVAKALYASVGFTNPHRVEGVDEEIMELTL